MKVFNVSDRVIVTNCQSTDANQFNGRKGTIVSLNRYFLWPYNVQLDGAEVTTPFKSDEIELIPSKVHFRCVGKKPQTQLILDHLDERPHITAVEAWSLYSIRSLSRRICDLKSEGHKFVELPVVAPNGQRYVRYQYLGKVNA